VGSGSCWLGLSLGAVERLLAGGERRGGCSREIECGIGSRATLIATIWPCWNGGLMLAVQCELFGSAMQQTHTGGLSSFGVHGGISDGSTRYVESLFGSECIFRQ